MFWVFVSIVVILWYISENGGVYGLIYGKDYKDYPEIVGKKVNKENFGKDFEQDTKTYQTTANDFTEDKNTVNKQEPTVERYGFSKEEVKEDKVKTELLKEEVKEDKSVELGTYEGTFNVDYSQDLEDTEVLEDTEGIENKEGIEKKDNGGHRVRRPRKIT